LKKCCPSNTNNEKISLSTKSKSYDLDVPAFGLPRRNRMLPIVADLLPQMLPFKPLPFSDVTDVTAFPTSYMKRSLKKAV
jgi:hypothetical protein